jgi:small-conductance mechanosensitive channel
MEKLNEILAYELGANTVEDYALALLVFIGLFLFFHIFKRIIVKRLKKLAERTENEFDDELIKTIDGISSFFYYVLSLYFPLKMIVTHVTAEKVIDGIFIVFVVYYVIKFLQTLIEYGLTRLAAKGDAHGVQARTTFSGIRLVVRIVLWIVALLLVLSNLGLNITSLIASLGIGSLAIALALQNVLRDLFSSFSIYFDKPFEIGDTIMVGDKQGVVKKVGWKTTRIETMQGEELVISNTELTTSQVQNFKKMHKRRVVMDIGIVYGTSLGKLKKINEVVKEIIDGVEGLEFGRSHFKEFGDFSLNYEIVYYVLTGDFAEHRDKQQIINFAIVEVFDKEGIEMAFPTQTVYVEKGAA